MLLVLQESKQLYAYSKVGGFYPSIFLLPLSNSYACHTERAADQFIIE